MKQKYKKTEIGVIPEDWELSTLKDAFPRLDAGVSVNSDTESLSDYYVLKTSAVRNGTVYLQEAKPVIPADFQRLKCPVKKGSIVISRMNTPLMVGECGYVHEANANTYLPDRLWQIENPAGSDYSFEWLNYLLNTSQYKAAIRSTATGTSNSMKNIAKDRLLEITIPKPALPEQELIAEALSDIDELISSLEEMIAKKKAIKQGAMQQLLTKGKRVYEDSEWIEIKLGEKGSLIKEAINPQLYPEEQFWEYSMPAFDVDQAPVKQFGKNMHSNRIAIKGEVLLFNKLNVRQKRVWNIKQCAPNALCSSEFLPYRSSEISLDLLKHILLTDKVTYDFIGMSTGTSNSQKRITPQNFLEYVVTIPENIEEQKAIASVLTEMDLEVSGIQKKINKALKIKQGMMQQLLTGKIRLV